MTWSAGYQAYILNLGFLATASDWDPAGLTVDEGAGPVTSTSIFALGTYILGVSGPGYTGAINSTIFADQPAILQPNPQSINSQ